MTEKKFCVRLCVLRGRWLGLAESVGDKVLDSDGNQEREQNEATPQNPADDGVGRSCYKSSWGWGT